MSSSKGIGLSQSGQDADGYGGSMPAAQAPLINLTDFPLVLFVTLQLHKTDASVNGHSTAVCSCGGPCCVGLMKSYSSTVIF